jgi:hypothetical protein
MRPWIRYLVVFLGLFWFLCFALVLIYGLGSVRWWQPIIWLLLGFAATWFFGLKPILVRRSIAWQSVPEQKLDIEFSEEGATVRAHGIGEFQRTWTDFLDLYLHKKGLLFYMSDGMKHWLPIRVFTSRAQMEELAEFIKVHCDALVSQNNETKEP